MTAELRFDQIQGNITPGFRKNHQAFVFLQFTAHGSARAWLKALVPSVTAASAVRAFLERLKRASEAEIPGWHTKWVNVAMSWPGLEALEAPGLDFFPDDFRQGLRQRAALIADDATIADWQVGGTAKTEAHVLVVIAADTAEDLSAEVERQRELARAHDLVHLKTYVGAELGGDLRGHEHFGYRDGISQPDKEPAREAPAWGEFVLGHQNQIGQRAPGPDWARHGSYAVFRRLSQDVARFRQTLADQASKTRRDLTPELLGAKLVGRWTTGAKLGDPATETTAPAWPGDEAARVTQSDFDNDPRGERFPLVAHIRKANPRDGDSQRRRLIRRGIPYGSPLAPGAGDDGAERGLLFLPYQASITDQFEHVQRNWFNNTKFPTPNTGRDPLVGQPGGPNETTLTLKGGPVSIALRQFVTMTGGGYFFSPSIQALKLLADPRRAAGAEGKAMADQYSRLGQFILREDPYDWRKELGIPERRLPDDLDNAPAVEVERVGMGKNRNAQRPFAEEYTLDQPEYWEGGLFWQIGDKTVRISKGIRIHYEYKDKDGKAVRRGLVIGFEGSGGGP
jgi:Dyp-type peroxidase family